MWIAPARTRPELERVIGELDLAEFCAVFVGDYVAGQELAGLVAKSWDLVGIDRRYRQFLAQFTPALIEAESPNLRPERAFVLYLEVVNAWRPLPFEDPGLPRDLLPVEWLPRRRRRSSSVSSNCWSFGVGSCGPVLAVRPTRLSRDRLTDDDPHPVGPHHRPRQISDREQEPGAIGHRPPWRSRRGRRCSPGHRAT